MDRSCNGPLLLAPLEEETQIALQPLIGGIEGQSLLAPFDRLVHHIEIPAGDRPQIEQTEAPAIAVVEIASGAVGLFDAVRAGPEQAGPVLLLVQLLGQVEPDLAPVRRLEPGPVEPIELL